jgi:hypothetical protein
MSANALSTSQFYKEQQMLQQGNTDELANRVRGVQTMTSNRYTPSFSHDLTTVRAMPSGTAFGEGRPGMGQEGEED